MVKSEIAFVARRFFSQPGVWILAAHRNIV
jgi:hypothetical protein